MKLYLSSFRLGNNPEHLRRLVGRNRTAAVIANADDYKNAEDRRASYEREASDLRSLGFEPSEVDLRDYFGASPTKLKNRLSPFGLVWVRGGNVFILRRAFSQSGLDSVLPELLEGGTVYGGYSAGAVILTPSLDGVQIVDDPDVVPHGYRGELAWDALRILPYALAPHYRSDHPESSAIGEMVEYLIGKHIPFIALRDGEAIVVEGTCERVVG